ncbi:MAG: peptide deformylase [Verrucomicrobiota bacterium]
MVLPVVKYGDPILRRRGAAVAEFDDSLRRFIADLFDTMYAAKGVGLAAHQVGRAVQVTVLDVQGIRDRPSQLWLDGAEADVDAFMPLVLVNPVVTPVGPRVAGPEGCLSFPEIYGEVERPAEVEVRAADGHGKPVSFRAAGLLARAVQHEVDHLNGILFIDRMNTLSREEVQADVEDLMARTKAALARR